MEIGSTVRLASDFLRSIGAHVSPDLGRAKGTVVDLIPGPGEAPARAAVLWETGAWAGLEKRALVTNLETL